MLPQTAYHIEAPAPMQECIQPCPWFNDTPNGELYWDALLQISRGNREEAERIVQAVQTGQPLIIDADWKRASPRTFDGVLDKIFISEASTSPQGLSFIGLLESIGVKEHNGFLNDVSPEASLKILEQKKEHLLVLQNFPQAGLSEEQKIARALYCWKLSHEIAGEKFLFHDYRLTQTFIGVLAEMVATFTQVQRVNGVEDLKQYLLRLGAITIQLKQTQQVMQLQRAQGIFPPRFMLEILLKILPGYFSSSGEQHPFWVHLADQVKPLKLREEEEGLLLAKRILEVSAIPAFESLHAYCQKLLEEVHTDHGVWALPDGSAYYAHVLKSHTTCDLTPSQVHALGWQEIERIEQEIRILLAKDGIEEPSKTVGELLKQVSQDPSLYYADTSEGRQACLEDFKAILDRSREVLWPLFGLTPKAPVSVLAVPKYEEMGMPAAFYLSPSMDGARSGVFYVNLRNMHEMCRMRMETLAVHEAEPGHHFQISIQMESPLHIMRRTQHFTAYAEGWALYAEKLAYERGFYSSPYQQLGHLQDELLRAVRLVVDTGIHEKRWSKEQAVRFMQEKLGYDYQSTVSEVERYFAVPGQACAYKVGQLKILELRQKARQALGERFDLREFHDLLLRSGSVPLAVLEEIIEQYIDVLLH
jgi:uncharacterized protein (DUF885 family)